MEELADAAQDAISIHALRVEGDHDIVQVRLFHRISIHALRVEGDLPSIAPQSTRTELFLSTPSGWRATSPRTGGRGYSAYFYPRPPGGGRRVIYALEDGYEVAFLSTPSGWRATDLWEPTAVPKIFLSTPSGWRATIKQIFQGVIDFVFLSTPSGWRATITSMGGQKMPLISIHALRVEGDERGIFCGRKSQNFYPRPPGGGRPFRRL